MQVPQSAINQLPILNSVSCEKCYSNFKQLGSWLNTRLPECIEDAVQLLLLMDRSMAVGDQLNGVLVSKT
jgi:hypothetical protein